jgi:hypothetical protein
MSASKAARVASLSATRSWLCLPVSRRACTDSTPKNPNTAAAVTTSDMTRTRTDRSVNQREDTERLLMGYSLVENPRRRPCRPIGLAAADVSQITITRRASPAQR